MTSSRKNQKAKLCAISAALALAAPPLSNAAPVVVNPGLSPLSPKKLQATTSPVAQQPTITQTETDTVVDRMGKLFHDFKFAQASELGEGHAQRLKAAKMPADYELESLLGDIMVRQGRFQKAIQHYSECTFLQPEKHQARFDIARVYEFMARFDDAQKILDQVSRKKQTPGEARRLARMQNDLRSYRKIGDPLTSDYLEDIFNERFVPRDFPLTIAIWVDPQLKAYKSLYTDAVRGAFSKWCNASGGFLTYRIVDRQQDARIVCKLLTTVRGGATRRTSSKLGETKRDSALNVDDHLKFSRVEVFYDVYEDPNTIADITLHEVGHALGLGHSESPLDIMYPTAGYPYAAQLSKRDANTIRKLYEIPRNAQ